MEVVQFQNVNALHFLFKHSKPFWRILPKNYLCPTAVVCIYSRLTLLYKRIGKLEAKISKNPYSQEPTSRPEYEAPYDSLHSSEDASHVYMELDDVPRPPPSGHAGKSDVFQL